MSTRDEIRALILAAQKYRLGEENAEGMNAYAFIARHIRLNRNVFLKVYDAVPESAELFREPRFLVEATSNSSGSRNLVQVFDAEMLSESFVLLAMEYVEGGSVLRHLQSGPLPLMRAINVTIGVLHGVARLHGAGLVHRDIKPANILLSSGSESFPVFSVLLRPIKPATFQLLRRDIRARRSIGLLMYLLPSFVRTLPP
jgi:serine/threonine protein kinase